MMSTTGSGTAATILNIRSFSLDFATDKVEVTAFGDVNKVYVQGLPDVTGEIEFFFDDADASLYTASRSTDAVKMYIYPSEDALTRYFYGTAWVDFSIEGAVDGAVQGSISFQAAGAWGAKLS
jgi:hypothetical protein